MSKLLITVVCAAVAFPTVSAAQEYGRGTPPRPTRGEHHQDHYDGARQYNGGGRHPYYAGHGQHHDGSGAYRSYNYGGYYPGYYGYGAQYPYYYGHDNHHHDNDDALWAIGGLVLGAIVGSAVERAAHPPATTSAPPPPASQPQKYCDRIEYDSAGNPYVERSCER